MNRRSILVTGASRGIGAAVVARLSPMNTIFATRRKVTDTPGDEIRWIEVDFENKEAPNDLCAAVKTAGVLLDGVVLNAGVAQEVDFSYPESDDELAHGLVDWNLWINLVAPLRCIRAFYAGQLLRDGASVVVVGSNLGRRGLAGKVSYCAAKSGLEGATRALAREFASHRIRVNAITPGLIRTDMSGFMSAENWIDYEKQVPLGRAGLPSDVASVVDFFLSDASNYVNGQVLDVDGGWSA